MSSRITGQFDIGMIMPVAIGLIYAGSGGWSAERWNAALAIMGITVARGAYHQGYWTENPELRRPPLGIEAPPRLPEDL